MLLAMLLATDLAGMLAREYLRVSYDRTGKLESPEEQHEENAAAAGRLGLILGDPYAEPEAVSAARWSTRVRGEFERLVCDLEDGNFGARVLVLWDSLRGGRSVKDWVRLVDGCEAARVLIYVKTHDRIYDPVNGRDRRSLLEDAVDAEWDNYKRRDAIKRTSAARAAKGAVHGKIPYGYRRVYDDASGALLRQEGDPAEAPLIKELFTRLHAGAAVNVIERDWAARGIMTRGTKRNPPRPFRHSDLIRMAKNPTYAGLRTWQPKGTRREWGSLDGAVEAAWPAIVDADVFYAVHALLSDPGRRTTRDGRARHLLGMIAVCASCGGVLTVAYRHEERKPRRYKCRSGGCTDISADDLDKIAEEEIKEFLSREDNACRLRVAAAGAPELRQVLAELAAARASLDAWRDKAARRLVTAESFAVIEPPIVEDIRRLSQRQRELSVPPDMAGWAGTRAEVDANWEKAPIELRRKMARKLLSDTYLGTLAVHPSPDGQGRIPAAWRVQWGQAKPPAYDVLLVRDAARAGVTPGEYQGRLDAGFLYCRHHEEFHAAAEFGPNRGRPGMRERRCKRAATEVRGRNDVNLLARRAKVTVEQYGKERAAGRLFCSRCQAFHPEGEFGTDRARPDGKAGSCKESMRKKAATA